MVAHVLPVGIRGIVVAGLLAALMSSLAGAFNACATLFTIDFYGRMRPGTSQERLVWVGRIATGVMVLIGLLWIPVIRGGRGLYDYLQGMQAYLAPPIFVVFFLGVFHKRLNAKGFSAHRRFHPGYLPAGCRYARETHPRVSLPGRIVPLDHEQHILPILQYYHPARFIDCDGRGQLHDFGSFVCADQWIDVCHAD